MISVIQKVIVSIFQIKNWFNLNIRIVKASGFENRNRYLQKSNQNNKENETKVALQSRHELNSNDADTHGFAESFVKKRKKADWKFRTTPNLFSSLWSKRPIFV